MMKATSPHGELEAKGKRVCDLTPHHMRNLKARAYCLKRLSRAVKPRDRANVQKDKP